jgi:hypothetical protein
MILGGGTILDITITHSPPRSKNWYPRPSPFSPRIIQNSLPFDLPPKVVDPTPIASYALCVVHCTWDISFAYLVLERIGDQFCRKT